MGCRRYFSQQLAAAEDRPRLETDPSAASAARLIA
jgi:hypothetical protein